MRLLAAEGVSKKFGGLQAVYNMNIWLDLGEVVSIIGPNGAGKTTLLNLLSGYLKPDKGVIKIFGKDVSKMSAERIARMGVGRTFQQPKVFEKLTVYENILISVLNLCKDIDDPHGRARMYTEMFGLGNVINHEARALSFGQQRLLEIARVLASDPKVIFLDEPTSGVHISLIKRLEEIIKKLKNEGKTILIVEHNMPFVAKVSDRVIVMSNGSKIAEGTYEEVKENAKVIEAYLGGR